MMKNKSALFSWQSVVTVFLLGVFSTWWLFVQRTSDPGNTEHQLFAASYGLIALWGGFWGLLEAKKWGFLKSVFGKSIAYFSFGLLMQEFGQLSYSYYIYVLHVDIPYPSIGDVGYFSSMVFYALGLYYLSKVIGVKLNLRSYKKNWLFLLIPIVLLITSYTLFLQGYDFNWDNPIKVFLDFGYPLGEAIYLSIAFLSYLLSRKVLGGVMKNKVLLLLCALVVQYIADFTFLYQSQTETWYVGGNNDLIYLIAYALMSIALLRFSHALDKS